MGMKRRLNYLMFIFFFGAVVVQHNDPDFYFWMPFYGFAAICSAYFFFKSAIPKLMTQIFALSVAVAAIYVLFPTFASGGSVLQVEQIYELSGSTIALAWVLVLSFVCKTNENTVSSVV